MKIDMYWVPQCLSGRLAIMPRPRAGDWLPEEIRAWHREGINVIVSLLTQFEIEELNLQHEADVCAVNGIKFISYPILDRQVPQSVSATQQLIKQIQSWLADHQGVAIHCRMGIGRSALIVACVLQQQGFRTNLAFDVIQMARGVSVPDTREQRQG